MMHLQLCAITWLGSACPHCLLLTARVVISQWEPTREGYLRFLVESKTLFQTLEDIVAQASHPECERPSAQSAPQPHLRPLHARFSQVLLVQMQHMCLQMPASRLRGLSVAQHWQRTSTGSSRHTVLRLRRSRRMALE